MPKNIQQSSGNGKAVAPKSKTTIPTAPGMGPGASRSVKGPKVDARQQPSKSKGMGTAAPKLDLKPLMGKN